MKLFCIRSHDVENKVIGDHTGKICANPVQIVELVHIFDRLQSPACPVDWNEID